MRARAVEAGRGQEPDAGAYVAGLNECGRIFTLFSRSEQDLARAGVAGKGRQTSAEPLGAMLRVPLSFQARPKSYPEGPLENPSESFAKLSEAVDNKQRVLHRRSYPPAKTKHCCISGKMFRETPRQVFRQQEFRETLRQSFVTAGRTLRRQQVSATRTVGLPTQRALQRWQRRFCVADGTKALLWQ